MLLKSGITCECCKCKALITTGDFKYKYRKKIFCFKCGINNSKKGTAMANKPANAAQKKWMSDITDYVNENGLSLLYGREVFEFIDVQRHHVLGRSAKQNKVHIGHYFILPVPFELHDPNVNHEFHIHKCKKAFVSQFGAQKDIFSMMYWDMKEQGYIVPDISIFSAIMATRA